MAVEIGQEAPDFELDNQFGETVRLSNHRGHENVLLVFFPKAFTGTCTGELRALRDESSQLVAAGAVTLAVSCDTTATLKAFADSLGLPFNLLSDFWPHGATCHQYGVFIESRGFPMRGTFLIDKSGIVRWSVVQSPADARPLADYHAALAELA